MSTVLQVLSLRIKTVAGWQDPYDLDDPVVAIVGPVDTGKSSLVDCIAFALGKDIDAFRGAVHTHLREVELRIRVSSGIFILRRARKTSSYIEDFDAAGTSVNHFPVKPHEERQLISSWLLERLGLDELLSSVLLPGGKSLDFPTALLPYCYLTQSDIDRYIIQATRHDAVRLVTLKLLFNLTTPEHERLNSTIRNVDNDIERRRRRAQLIESFLSESQMTNLGVVTDEINRLRQAELEAASRLGSWKNDGRAASQFADHERQRVAVGRQTVSELEGSLDKLRRQQEKAEEKVEACQEALAALTNLEERPPKLHVVLPRCPACEGELTDRIPEPGRCYICGQLLAGRIQAAERKLLGMAYANAQTEASNLLIAVKDAEERAQSARMTLKKLLQEADDRVGDAVTPYVDAISAASSDLARIRGELASLERISDSHNRLRVQFEDIAEMEEQQKDRRRQALEAGQLESAESVLDALNAIFRRIVEGIKLPHATGRARLDPDSFMPLVDEQQFPQRGGGARSAVSIAYSLTLLTYALENELAKLPALLIIDSPQKNFGANEDDKKLAHRVYERFLDYTSELKDVKEGQFYRPFQLIIVDNDLHTDIRRRIKVHQFTHENGFIRGLADPHRTPDQGVALAIHDPGDTPELDFGEPELKGAFKRPRR